MRIMWLTNVETPLVSKALNHPKSVFGGWLDVLSEQVMLKNDLICVCKSTNSTCGTFGNLSYYTFHENDQLIDLFKSIIEKENPEVIHVWGTEFKHSYCMMDAAKQAGYNDKCLVSIQGLVSVFAQHYYAGLPFNIICGFTIRDILRQDNIMLAARRFHRRGETEIRTLKIAKNVIGRTDWDKACTTMINPHLRYYHCNETLRESFYQYHWNPSSMQKQTIFVSQCSYPIKGFHFVLEAMKILKKDFPQCHVFTTGMDLLHMTVWDRLKLSNYQRYLLNQIKKYDLKDNITFLGQLDELAMVKSYLSANVFVSASVIENSSNSVGEAMLLGCPVVSSNVGGTKNLLVDGQDGFLYPSTEPYMLAYYIKMIFNDDNLAIKLSENARRHALNTHSKEANYGQLMAIYRKVADNENRSSGFTSSL